MLTLRARLVLVNVLVFLVTFVVLAAVLTSDLLRHLNAQVDTELAHLSDAALEHVEFSDSKPRLHEREEEDAADLGARGFVRLLDARGAIADGMGDYRTPAVNGAALSTSSRGGAVTMRDEDGQRLRVYTRPVLADVGGGAVLGYVQAGIVPNELIEIIAQLRRSLLIATPLALFGAGLAAFWAARKALRPLTEMTRSASDISAESLSERRLPIPAAHDEVQALALDFNAMLDRLAAAFARQRRFTADASHELRTPVTAILGQAELALSRPRSPESYQETLVRIQGEAERMHRLIGRLLMLARVDGSPPVLSTRPTDVAALLRSLTETLAEEADAKGIALRMEGPTKAVVETDADTLTQILLKVLENALAYTDRGEVVVALANDANALSIAVKDSGPGIAPDDLSLIFEPFFRADPSRQRRSGGMGLGLTLAHELTQLLGGRIAVANRPEGGAVFTVTLPHHVA